MAALNRGQRRRIETTDRAPSRLALASLDLLVLMRASGYFCTKLRCFEYDSGQRYGDQSSCLPLWVAPRWRVSPPFYLILTFNTQYLAVLIVF
jgi:hypothetical protein